jgi:catechol 2,3-dioxygenase-like lactoylglutathione lyase family enzyme
MRAQQILETCLYVDDLDVAADFYQRVLGLEKESRVEGRHIFFRCGDAMFLVFNSKQTQQADGIVPTHGALGPGHVAFAVERSELDHWREQLAAQHVPLEKEIRWPNGGHSIYFRDPAGNSVELATPQVWGITQRRQA